MNKLYEEGLERNFERAKQNKSFSIGNFGFYITDRAEFVKLFKSLQTAIAFFNDEYLLDDYYGIEDIEDEDILNALSDFNTFKQYDEMIIYMSNNIGKAV